MYQNSGQKDCSFWSNSFVCAPKQTKDCGLAGLYVYFETCSKFIRASINLGHNPGLWGAEVVASFVFAGFMGTEDPR